MSYQPITYVGDGSKVAFEVPFEYLEPGDVKVKITHTPTNNDVTTDFTINMSDVTNVLQISPVPTTEHKVEVYRLTSSLDQAGGAKGGGQVWAPIPTEKALKQLSLITEELRIQGEVNDELPPHNHDANYAAIDHNHDADYAAIDHNHALGDLLDVGTSGASPGDGLIYDGSSWSPSPVSAPGGGSFTSLSDTPSSLGSANQVVAVNGSGTAIEFTSLGSASLLDEGTGANNLVQLDDTGKLPAIDGSQLTNIPGGAAYDPGTWLTIGAAGAPAFAEGCSAYGGDYQAPQIRKDSNGFVELRGLVQRTGDGLLFTLPVGYRPKASGKLMFPSAHQHRVNILLSGDVIVRMNTQNYGGLDGIRFEADG